MSDLREMDVLRVKPGELLVLKCEYIPTMEEINRLKGEIDAAGVRAVIIGPGIEIAAVQEA